MNPQFMPQGQPQAQQFPPQFAPAPQATAGGNLWGTPQPQAPAGNGFGGGGAFGQPMGGAAFSSPQMPQGDGQAVSFDPATFTAGGMIDNVWVRFDAGKACYFDYNGKQAPAPAVCYTLTILDAANKQPVPGSTPAPKYWTVGKVEDFQPKPNGTQFWSPSGKTGMNQGSNWAIFIDRAIKAGIPRQAFATGQVDSLNGLVAFVQIVHAEGRDGLKGQMGTDGKPKGDSGTLIITMLPGGQQAPQAQSPQAMAQAPAPMAPQAPQAPMVPGMPPAQQYAQQPMAPAPMAPQYAQAQAPMGQMPQAPAGPDPNEARNLLMAVIQTNPTTMQAFNVGVFQRSMTNEALRNMVMSRDFQASVLGAPINLP